MNALMLLFDPVTHADDLIADETIDLSDEAVKLLSQQCYIDGIEIRRTIGEKPDTAVRTDGESPYSASCFLDFTEGWLTMAPPDCRPVRLCQLSEDDDIHRYVSILSSRLDRVTRWLYDLSAISISHPDPFMVLHTGNELLNLELVLFDGSFNLVAYAMENPYRSKIFAETIEKGYATGVSEEHQRRYRQMLADSPNGFETYFHDIDADTPNWVHPFSTCHGNSYRLHVMFGEEHWKGMRTLVDTLVMHLQSVLERIETVPEHATATDFVEEVVTTSLGNEQANQRARFFGWTPSNFYRVARAEPLDEAYPDPRLDGICYQIRRRHPEVHMTTMQHGITLVLGSDDDDSASVLMSDGIKEQLTGEHLWMVVSDPVPNLDDIPRAYDDTCSAFAIIRNDPAIRRRIEEMHVIPYDQCKLDLIKSSIDQTAEKHDVVPRFLHAIRTYDKEHGTDFEETLFTYLADMMVKADTCSHLSIHRSTLDYRLDRLHDHFGVDLDDRETVEHLEVLGIIRRSGRESSKFFPTSHRP